MIFRPHLSPTSQRRAVILLVVLALLTLFAILGLAFVYYSQAQATSSRFWRESEFDRYRAGIPPAPPNPNPGPTQPPDLPTPTAARWALAQLIYDVEDPTLGTSAGLQPHTSAIRGHSLARTMYGFNDTTLNTQAYSGTGRWHNTPAGLGFDEAQMMNFTLFTDSAGNGFVMDPERPGVLRNSAASPRAPFTGGWNVSYTYPDQHSMFLAAVKADGTVMVPSFHRPWMFGSLAQTNPNWTNTQGKFLSLRPRPIDMGPGFPYPVDAGGDVKNKSWAPGGNDSIWMDMGYPVLTAQDGRKYKPLFAWLVEPLDNRVNVNAHGNLMGPGGMHASNQGWGKWEVNLAQVLSAKANPLDPTETVPREWRNLFLGNPAVATNFYGRYGRDGAASSTGNVTGGNRTPRFFAQSDYNASNETGTPPTPSTPWQLPTAATAPAVPYGFPNYPSAYANATGLEVREHALLYDFFNPNGWTWTLPPVPPATVGQTTSEFDDRLVEDSLVDLRRLLYMGQLNSEVAYSRLTRLCPQNFSDDPTIITNPVQLAANARRRNLVTTHSFDVGRPGIGPWIHDRATGSGFAVAAASPVGSIPAGPAVPMPALSSRNTNPAPVGDFDQVSWRSTVAPLEKVDLNRKMEPYPHRVPGNTVELRHSVRFDDTSSTYTPTGRTVAQQFMMAQQDRQALARDVYERLVAVTGARVPVPAQPPAPPTPPTDSEMEPLRWLAQLAVNIVDYMDDDEISTPFNFYGYNGEQPIDAVTTNASTNEKLPRYWVFGTEMPAVVLNEVHTEYRLPRDPNDRTVVVNGAYPVKVYAELHNPFPTSVPGSVQQQDAQAVPLHMAAGGNGQAAYSPFRIEISNTNNDAQLGPLYPNPARHNAVGAVDELRQTAGATPRPSRAEFTAAGTRTIGDPNANVPVAVSPQGFVVVGPDAVDAYDTIRRGPANVPLYVAADMHYNATCTAGPPVSVTPDDRPDKLLVALRRLANPHLPPNDNILVNGSPNPAYNPYITVDYLENVPLNEIRDDPANPDPNNPDRYQAVGKRQPYASHRSQRAPQQSQTGGNADNIQHTLGRVNNPLPASNRFDWLMHLDRPLISPLELLTVSRGRPFDLTHQFVDNNGVNKHLVPWFDQDLSDPAQQTVMPTGSHRLWRLFEVVETGDLATGVGRRGRIPGKININTIWDIETFMALCDPQPGNNFNQATVANLWNALVASRTPGLNQATPTLSGSDRPFHGLGVGHRPTTDPQGPQDINNTILRSAMIPSGMSLVHGNGTVPRLLEISSPSIGHPALQYELLNKIFNQITTRSNVFAVYLTVGFFEVTDESTRPVKLGAEIGASTGQNIRHRMFCIVDRSQLTLDLQKVDGSQLRTATISPLPAVPPALTPTPPAPSPGAVRQKNDPNVWVSIPRVRDPNTNQPIPGSGLQGVYRYQGVGPGVPASPSPLRDIPWRIQKGTILLVDDGVRQETIEVLEVDPVNNMDPGNDRFRAEFKRWHHQGFRIRMQGNPGPQPNFSYTSSVYAPVVPHVMIID